MTDCDPGSASTLEQRDCEGDMFHDRITVDKDTFDQMVQNPSSYNHQEIIERKCSNAFCHGQETFLRIIDLGDQCYQTPGVRSCAYCCEYEEPTDEEYDSTPCVTDGYCKSGFHMITKKSQCEDVDHEKNFQKECTNGEVNTVCQCPDQNGNFDDYQNCRSVTDGKCQFNNESGQWVRLVGSCTIPGLENTVCDKTEPCSPPECVQGEEKTNCCQTLKDQPLDQGDLCIQTIKKCYDKDGNQLYGKVPCPDCEGDVCKKRNIRDCNKNQVERCTAAMGGELYCDGRIPVCMTKQGEKQERYCKLEDRPDRLKEDCKYKIDCQCNAFKCSDNSVSIEGVNKAMLEALKFRTNDLHETYGPDLNFFIGGGDKTAHTTQGCFHHYRSKNHNAATNGIDLTYSFDDLENKCGIEIPENNQVNVTVWVDDARHTSNPIASATPFAHVSYFQYAC